MKRQRHRHMDSATTTQYQFWALQVPPKKEESNVKSFKQRTSSCASGEREGASVGRSCNKIKRVQETVSAANVPATTRREKRKQQRPRHSRKIEGSVPRCSWRLAQRTEHVVVNSPSGRTKQEQLAVECDQQAVKVQSRRATQLKPSTNHCWR